MEVEYGQGGYVTLRCRLPVPPPPDPLADPPGPGPGPDCGRLASWMCEGSAEYCGELVPFEPAQGLGYDNYPINGETNQNQYRSYLRRDLRMSIQYAAGLVACKAGTWSHGNGGPIGLGDMSESDGSIPGTSIGQPGHPSGTHTGGSDIDTAYFQLDTLDNHLRPVCPHVSVGGDQFHCVAPPDNLDVWRTALFVGALAANPSLRVIGVDGQIGPLIEAAMTELCRLGWTDACNRAPLAYETVDGGQGWFFFHHHNMHLSLSVPRAR